MTRMWSVGVLLAVGCVRPEAPPLPRLVDVSPTVRRGPAELEPSRLVAAYVVPRGGESPVRVHPEDNALRIIEMVGVLDVDGELYINDVLHEQLPDAFGYGKISKAQVRVTAAHGTVTRTSQRYTPHRDVRLALDTGHRLRVEVLGQRASFVLAPRYDAGDYAPYRVEGAPGAFGPAGKRGGAGARGRDGEDGDDGDAGGIGARGEDGDDGTDGTNGTGGRSGRNGGPGSPGDPGPDLQVKIRPIYSKFFPDEQLVYVEVDASYRRRGGKTPYQSRNVNYVFHARERFQISSVGGAGGRGGAGGWGGAGGRGGEGGDGGDGGDGGPGADRETGRGGRGGDGGNGGDGGDGGDGGRAGNGGNGARGGAGGDGGRIIAQVGGDPAFRQTVRRLLSFVSRGGLGGAGGQAGRAGARGRGGKAGSAGDPGQGGQGGFGPSGRGPNGADGKAGKRGRRGRDGPAGRRGRAGRPGRAGQAGSRPW